MTLSTMPAPPSVSNLTRECESFRRFNRMYTRVIGTLNEGLLNSEYSLAEARILYELATRAAPRASEIAEVLDLDPGYLSRVLRKFEEAGLTRKKVSEQDGRFADLVLTPRGRAAFKKLNARSEEQARSLLAALPPTACAELIRSMQSIEHILQRAGDTPVPFILRPHRAGDMGWIVHREGIGYAEQFGWDESFEALVASIVHHFITHFDPSRERCWIAEVDGHNVGHVFLVGHPTERNTAKLRLLFVEPCARGMGLGDALVKECIGFARTAGYNKVVLWTQSMLTAAHRIYQRAGFHLVREEAHRSFGTDLIGQEWELNLIPPVSSVA